MNVLVALVLLGTLADGPKGSQVVTLAELPRVEVSTSPDDVLVLEWAFEEWDAYTEGMYSCELEYVLRNIQVSSPEDLTLHLSELAFSNLNEVVGRHDPNESEERALAEAHLVALGFRFIERSVPGDRAEARKLAYLRWLEAVVQ